MTLPEDFNCTEKDLPVFYSYRSESAGLAAAALVDVSHFGESDAASDTPLENKRMDRAFYFTEEESKK